MLKNYIKIAIRCLLRYRRYTLINILGLSTAVCCCILIMLFVKSELSYDRFHPKADRIYRVWQHEKYQGEDFIGAITPIPMGPAMKDAYPEIEAMCRVNPLSALIKVNGTSFNENIRMVDPSFFSVFGFELLSGNRFYPFSSGNTMIITPALAKKYFGTDNAVGRTVELLAGDQKVNFTVSGIAAPAPEESSIKYDVLLSTASDRLFYREKQKKSWFNVFNETYVLLQKNSDPGHLEKKFPALLKQQLGANYKEGSFVMHLQNITDIHLDISLAPGVEPTGNPKHSYILSSIAILLLIVACINFITLSLGHSASRSLEVGIRKTLGAERRQLVLQFWGESFVITLLSVGCGILLSLLLLKPFNSLIEKNLSLTPDFSFIVFVFAFTVFTALVSGIYPALFISRFNPVQALKKILKQPASAGIFRQGLITAQFIVSISLIICTLMVQEQIGYLMNKDLGYNKEQIVVVATNKNRKSGGELAQLYRNELLKHPEILSTCTSAWTMADQAWATVGFTDDKKNYREFQVNAVDPDFITTMNISMQQGRNLMAGNSAYASGNVLVNESFVKEFGLHNPVDKKLPGRYPQTIAGVIRDFNFEPLHNKIKPLVLVQNPDSLLLYCENVMFPTSPQPRVSIRLKPGNAESNIAILKQAWKKVAPEQDFDFRFLDEQLAAVYRQEEKTMTLIKIASGLSVFIACIGLLGLATLIVSRRTKEIGIRKVMGATLVSITALISLNFVWLVCIASAISIPLSWWALNKWLQDFAYRAGMSWWFFAAGCLATLIIAVGTVSLQTVKAGMANPIKSLRTE